MHDDGVIVDIVLDDGLLHLELANLADRPALDVACSFDSSIVDVDGRDVTQLRLFRRVELLGPRRRIRTLVDSVAGYFARDEPARIAATVSFARPGEPRRETKVTHDLELYRELAYRV
jgi:hypothetical protein